MPRRERWSIIGDILTAIVHERAKGEGVARISNVAARANIAYDRLQPYLDELEQAGLVTPTPGGVPELTPKGREFLRHYRTWTDVLDDFGLA